jgi:hypothetical protein
MLWEGVGGSGMDADVLRSTVLAVFSAVIAAAAAGIAAWRSYIAGQQAREAKMSRELSAVISLFNAHQSEEASRIRRLIRTGEIADQFDDADTRAQLRHYVNQLNFIATLRARKLLGDDLLEDLFYEPAKACWGRCAKQFVREVRETQNPDFARELQKWIGAPEP